jgi:hypothetical protein
MGGLFGTPDYVRCCCGGVFYPCECRLDGTAVSGGDLTLSDGTPCEIDPISPAILGTGLPTTNKAWNEGDCAILVQVTHRITAFPPNCMQTLPDELGKRVVFVFKLTSTTNPLIDNTTVQLYDYYAAVYNITDDTLLGLAYEYEVCCINETPQVPATSHLGWIKIFGVPLGSSEYTMWLYNPDTASTYGDCGWRPPGY